MVKHRHESTGEEAGIPPPLVVFSILLNERIHLLATNFLEELAKSDALVTVDVKHLYNGLEIAIDSTVEIFVREGHPPGLGRTMDG